MSIIIVNRIHIVSRAKLNNTLFLSFKPFLSSSALYKLFLDKSKLPKIDEKDIEEQFIHGSGPGGSNVNTILNCVLLKHLPTGLVVKSHETRELNKNRKIAREKLQTKLDNLINGEQSVSAQRKKYCDSKLASKELKAAKLRELKLNFKAREGLLKEKANKNDIHVQGNN